MLDGILDNHPDISKFLRAHLINWLVHVCEVLTKDDATLPFVAISMQSPDPGEAPAEILKGNVDGTDAPLSIPTAHS